MSSRSVASVDIHVLSAAAAAAPSRSPLYRDALSSVLSFLSLRELAATLLVSKDWMATVLSMKPSMLPAAISFPQWDALLSSRLRRHVGELGEVDDDGYTLSLPSTQLIVASLALPQLQSLTVALPRPADDEPLRFPPRLQRLSLRLLSSMCADSETAALLSAAIGTLSQLHTLHLELPEGQLSLAVLQQLPLFQDLDIFMDFSMVEQSAAELRALPWLHRLCVVASLETEPEDCDAFLSALVRDDPEAELRAVQWRELSLNMHFTDESAQNLPLLSSLERLQADLSECSRFEFLAAMPRLTALEILLFGMKEDEWRNLLGVFASDGLLRLQTLGLHCGPCNSDDLSALLSHTPSLTDLVLGQLSEVASLSIFQRLPHLSETLTQLTLECSTGWSLTAADLPALLVLQQLRTLRLIQWPNQRPDMLTAADRAPFEQRPCSVLPYLEVFEWTICLRNLPSLCRAPVPAPAD
jgi:hypothetical protein